MLPTSSNLSAARRTSRFSNSRLAFGARGRAAPPRGPPGTVRALSRLGRSLRAVMGWDDNNRIQVVQDNALLARPGVPLERVLLQRIPREAEVVMIGEATHGTDDFYRMRAELSKLLIQERGFAAVVVEADFPDAFRANLYARGLPSSDTTAEEALRDFKRFPTWMWRNSVTTEFIDWLKRHNDRVRAGGAPRPSARGARGVSFLGMDVYSLHSSAAKVIEFLSAADPDAADVARKRYACFDRYGADTMHYAYAVGVGGAPSCAPAALAQLKEVVEKAAGYGAAMDGELGEELAFAARCNAAVVTGAEAYYRNMFFGEDTTWNLRDRHFLDTVVAIREHLSRPPDAGAKPGPWAGGPPARLVLWAHNSHLGDASATDMGWKRGEINVGQLVRERFGRKATYSIGFTTNHGTVAAADDWDTPVQIKSVRKGMPGSFEHLFHKCGMPEFALDLRQGSSDLREALEGPLLERAIGVVYRPRTERQSHYFYASLPAQFDCVVHIDDSSALTPLEKTGAWETDEHAREDAPETYPFGV